MFDAISLYKLAGLTAGGIPETMSSGPTDSGPGGGINDFAAAAGLAGLLGWVRANGLALEAAGNVTAGAGAGGATGAGAGAGAGAEV